MERVGFGGARGAGHHDESDMREVGSTEGDTLREQRRGDSRRGGAIRGSGIGAEVLEIGPQSLAESRRYAILGAGGALLEGTEKSDTSPSSTQGGVSGAGLGGASETDRDSGDTAMRDRVSRSSNSTAPTQHPSGRWHPSPGDNGGSSGRDRSGRGRKTADRRGEAPRGETSDRSVARHRGKWYLAGPAPAEAGGRVGMGTDSMR